MNAWKVILGGTVLVLIGVLLGRMLNQPEPAAPVPEPGAESFAAPVREAESSRRAAPAPALPEPESHPRERAMTRQETPPGTPPGLEQAVAALLDYMEEPSWEAFRRLQRPASRTMDGGWIAAARRVLPEGSPDTGELSVLELVYRQGIEEHAAWSADAGAGSIQVSAGRWTSSGEFTSHPDVSGLPPSSQIASTIEVFDNRADLQRALESDGEVHHANIVMLLPDGGGFAARLYYAPAAGQWLLLRAESRGMRLPPL